MKKFLILFLLIFSSMNIAFSQIEEAKYCAVPKDTGNAVTTGLSNVTGVNYLSTKAIETAIQKSIKSQLGSKTNVEIYPYSFGALTQGKFKRMTIKSKLMNLDGLYVNNFKAETVCDYNHVGISGEDILFKENFVMEFQTKINNDDLKKTTSSPQYLKAVSSAKISSFGQTFLRVNFMTLAIKNNKLVMSMKIMSPILWGTDQKSVTAVSDLKIVNGKLVYSNVNIMNSNLPPKITNAISSLINIINPFTMEIKLTKNTVGYTKLKNVIIENNEIKINGILFVPRNN